VPSRRIIVDFYFKYFLHLKITSMLRQLPIIALIIGIMLFFILVACDEDAPGGGNWDNPKTPIPPISK
jgi:hypothetical protein